MAVKKKVVKKKKDDGIRAYFTGEDWKDIQIFVSAEIGKALITQDSITKMGIKLNDGEEIFDRSLMDASIGVGKGLTSRITSNIMRKITAKLPPTPNT